MMDRASEPPAACQAGLTAAELLLFRGIKAWATMLVADVRPHEAVVAAIGRKTSKRTASLFVAWIQAVEAASRRPLRLTCPDCGGVSTDAQRLILACGVAPVDRGLAEALTTPLLHDAPMIIQLSRTLNAALAADGWRLPVRRLEGEPQPTPERTTLH